MWSEAEGGDELCGMREKVMSYVECEGEGGDELGVIVKEDVVMCCVECDGECGDELCGVREKVVMSCEGEGGRSVLCTCTE